MKDDKHDPINLTNSSMNFDEDRAADILRSDIPSMPIEGNDYNPLEDRIVSAPANTAENKSNVPANEDNKAALENNIASSGDEIKHDKGDILTNANIKEIIPPAGEKERPSKQEKKISSATGDNNKKIASAAVKDNKKDNPKQNNAGAKNKVYGVSRNTEVKKNQGSYSIQVASYDNISRAERERTLLKSKKYDAYIDKGFVNGKNYFRLRVGPVSSSKEAYSLLSDLQNDSRYAESYIVTQ